MKFDNCMNILTELEIWIQKLRTVAKLTTKSGEYSNNEILCKYDEVICEMMDRKKELLNKPLD